MPKNLFLRSYFLCLTTSLTFLATNNVLADDNNSTASGAFKEMLLSTTGSVDPTLNMVNVFNPQPKAIDENNPDIFFTADELENNQELEIITATGNVEIIRNNLTLQANKIVYNQRDDIVTAIGDVVILQDDGSVIFSNFVELTNQMSQGEMENIKIILADKSRIAASSMTREDKDRKTMTDIVYSPCNICENKSPFWQLKAKKAIHNAVAQDVYYQNATLEFKGVPVFYTPFLSHPDPSVKKRSGILFPEMSSNNYLGAAFQPQYFWNIDDNQNILLKPIFTSDKGIVASADYHKFFYKGEVKTSGTLMKDPDTKKTRGNLFLQGRYEINDFWVADADINYASSDNYLKDLSLPKKDDPWLTSTIRAQGFDNRNYASLEAYYYTMLSNDLQGLEEPLVVPLLDYENISSPDPYGAYNKTKLNFASITRDEETSSHRATMINSWNLPYTSPYGEKYRLSASLKSDVYYVDNYKNDDNENYSGATGRVFPQVGLEWRLPFVKASENSRQILEPVIVAVAAPNNGDSKDDEIPNEDSRDTELNDTNILDIDRYAGYDRNDNGSRISYGINWSSYGDKYGRSSFFLAQSYKLDKDESFTRDESSNDNLTDYVGRAYAAPNEYLDLNYRFKISKDDYKITYSELSARMGPPILNGYVSYIRFPENKNYSLQNGEERKEVYTSLNSRLSRDWNISIYNRQDLMDKGGSIEHGGTLTYENECTKFFFIARKYNSEDEEYDDDNYELSFTFFLKTLGGAGSE